MYHETSLFFKCFITKSTLKIAWYICWFSTFWVIMTEPANFLFEITFTLYEIYAFFLMMSLCSSFLCFTRSGLSVNFKPQVWQDIIFSDWCPACSWWVIRRCWYNSFFVNPWKLQSLQLNCFSCIFGSCVVSMCSSSWHISLKLMSQWSHLYLMSCSWWVCSWASSIPKDSNSISQSLHRNCCLNFFDCLTNKFIFQENNLVSQNCYIHLLGSQIYFQWSPLPVLYHFSHFKYQLH